MLEPVRPAAADATLSTISPPSAPQEETETIERETLPVLPEPLDTTTEPRATPWSESIGNPIPDRDLAIHTQFVSDLRSLIYHPRPDPTPQLTHLAPPYTTSGLASFEIRIAHVSAGIERSLFEAGLEAGLSDAIILKLADIFAWDIDFALDVQPGDSFTVIYEQKYWLGRKISDGPILAAQFSNDGRTYRAIGFRGADGKIGYYTPAGRNLKRSFLRAPVKFSRVSSRFATSRYHPILKTWRAHTGVDYAAPLGTPVRATGSGRIVLMGHNGGYGNTVVIDHGGAYRTLYAHLSNFAAGLRAGRLVEQGDIVGYVGKSGLATGPHLHYEFQVNGRHINPLTFESSDGDTIISTAREEFSRVAHTWTARLKSIGGQDLAVAEFR